MPKIGKPKVLVIEDDKFILKAMKYKFEEAKFEIRTSNSAEEGIDILKTWRPHAIVLDILLPGMDGYAFLRQIKNNPELKAIPVVISSNLDQELGTDSKAVDYIVKSDLDLDELVTRVRSHIK